MLKISDFTINLDAGIANITVNTAVYAIEAIHLASYEFNDRYHMLITPATNDSVIIIFEAKNTHKSIDGDIKEFLNTLIDHQIRIQLDKANGRIRDLIVAHAFSPFDLKKVIDSK